MLNIPILTNATMRTIKIINLIHKLFLIVNKYYVNVKSFNILEEHIIYVLCVLKFQMFILQYSCVINMHNQFLFEIFECCSWQLIIKLTND